MVCNEATKHYKYLNKEVILIKYIILLLILVLSACNSTPEVTTKPTTTDIVQLIEKADRRFPEGVRGTFQIPIKASGTIRGTVFLNSDEDYRHPENITLALSPAIIDALSTTYGSSPDKFFINKTVEVKGNVKRIKTYFYKNGKRTKKYYFQTHIKVTEVDQIRVLS